MNYDDHVLLFATTIILVSGDLSWSCQKEKVVPKKKVLPKKSRAQKKKSCRKKEWYQRKTDVVKKKLDEKNYVALTGLRRNLY